MAGLDANLTREMLFSLRQNEDLKNLCHGTIMLLQKSVDLVYKSMTLIFEERQYWRHILDADPFEKIKVSFLHSGPMGFVSSMRKLLFNAQIYNKESTIDLKLAILRETFNKLASILGSLYRSGSVLKNISTDIENMAFTVIDIVDDSSSRDTASNSSSSSSSLSRSISMGVASKDQVFYTFIERSKVRLMWSLKNLISVFENLEDFSDVSSSFEEDSSRRGDAIAHLSAIDLLAFATEKFSVLEV